VASARGASFDVELEERIGAAIGRELRAVGADLFGGICVNVLRHPAWGRAQEVYGEDPHHLGEMGAAMCRGVQRRVMATVKHFALNSMENARFKVDVTVDERSLHEVYLPHFRRIVDEGVACVMTAYNSVNGQWCGEHRHLIGDVLRGEWGFDGFVISDWIFGLRDGAESLRAGLDVEMPYRMIRHEPIVRALADGTLDPSLVDAAVTRTLASMLRFGLGRLEDEPAAVLACPEHLALAREAAAASMVLLVNDPVDDVPLLPLRLGDHPTLAVVGRLADRRNLGDGGSSDVMAPDVVTALDGIRSRFPGCTVLAPDADGYHDPEEAAALAERADAAVVVVGYTKHDEGEFIGEMADGAGLERLRPGPDDPARVAVHREWMTEVNWPMPEVVRSRPSEVVFAAGGDRRSLRLSDEDVALIRAVARVQPRTVVVIVSGSAVIVEEWRDTVPAIVMSWYAGARGGDALADLLAGDVNPSGRLPCAIPRDESHLPDFDPDADTVVYDAFHGQWRLDRDGHEPAFPFGWGLSYTSFSLSSFSLSTSSLPSTAVDEIAMHAAVTVANTGDRDGRCVVQLYVGLPGGTVERPRRRLVGFAKVPVPAGESRTVTIPVSLEPLMVRDGDTWWLEPGEWRIEAARHCGDPDAVTALVALDERRRQASSPR
jgi:beta-glucosidase-like glycosyl hydrolase